ncbi:MAG TPA: ABC transporter substrate-binding protein [Acidisoma sp.]|jgi:NitT/TauT family transport system substrate-binding protein|uniref:ABC transporter substrate-binding protein n=1 Tax=Acidisoma sp. TaxID=1872115 RepID=UPI002CB182B9|nr:ABC transporter substrate-binding protein [Acidisoma sp.]HTH99532.1 ABC transporter substrate-binding protein [Acidisoma sp.]
MTGLLPKALSRRRTFQLAGAAAAVTALGAPRIARAAVTEVAFVEAVHNLGYIDLYVGQHAGYFDEAGIHLNLSAAGGDTQAFAAVLGQSALFGIGDPTMVPISVEKGGPGKVVGSVVQRAHYFGVSKTVKTITDPKQFKGLKIVTSPEPNTNYSVTKRLLTQAGLVIGKDVQIIQVSPGTEIGAMLAGQADVAIAYQPGVAEAESQGAKIIFDFSNAIGPFCNTGIMVLNQTIASKPEIIQALCNGFQKAMKRTYGDPAYAKKVAQMEFPQLSAAVINSAIDTELKYRIPSQSVVVDKTQWDNLIKMQVYLGNIKGTTTFDQIVDNTFANKAASA